MTINLWQLWCIIGIMLVIFMASIITLALIKRKKAKEEELKAKYTNQEATALTRVTLTEGRVSVSGKEWEARACYADEDIPEGRVVQIKRIEGKIMYVDNFIDDTGLEYTLHDGDLYSGAENLITPKGDFK
ncbi:MAG: NfeD family protein [Clostridium sp.]|nr:NfeD family protein [Clostridium sp.]